MKINFTIFYFLFLAIIFISCSHSKTPKKETEKVFLLDVKSNNLDTLITNSQTPIIIRYSNSSDYCKKADNKFIQQAKKYKNNNKFVRFNIDNQFSLAKQKKINCVPLTRIYYQGKLIKEYTGILANFEFNFLFKKINGIINQKAS